MKRRGEWERKGKEEERNEKGESGRKKRIKKDEELLFSSSKD